MGPFDWLRRARPAAPEPSAWEVRRQAGEVIVQEGETELARFAVKRARTIRVVPLTAGAGHGVAQRDGGWQVAVQHDGGDLLIGQPVSDWRAARDFARRLAEGSGVPLDELTERLFSKVGSFASAEEPPSDPSVAPSAKGVGAVARSTETDADIRG